MTTTEDGDAICLQIHLPEELTPTKIAGSNFSTHRVLEISRSVIIYLFLYLFTYLYMELSPFWETANCTAI
jgi:hypothetical protein